MFKSYSIRNEVMKVVEKKIERHQKELDTEVEMIDRDAEFLKQNAVPKHVNQIFSIEDPYPSAVSHGAQVSGKPRN